MNHDYSPILTMFLFIFQILLFHSFLSFLFHSSTLFHFKSTMNGYRVLKIAKLGEKSMLSYSNCHFCSF